MTTLSTWKSRLKKRLTARHKAWNAWKKAAKAVKDARAKVQKLEKAQATGLGRTNPNVVVRRDVVNQSARSAKVELIVLHDTEGSNVTGNSDLQGLANFFDNPAVQASSHVATDADGNSARFVDDSRKAWHCAAYNSASLGIEQIGFASQTNWPEAQLHETARWIAYWSAKHGIPIQKGAVSNGAVTRPGVLRHSDLGSAGGGHHDPGNGYPFETVLALATAYKAVRH